MTPIVEICDQPFDPETRLADFRDQLRHSGGLVSFTGIVRGEDGIEALELSHFDGFTQAQILEIANRATKRWPLEGILIVHRVGKMVPNEPIVLVAAASKHRREAFEAADFLMDYLKSEAPFWKKQYAGKDSAWIEPSSRDELDKKRWEI